jgi:hypothetical protein
MAKEKNSSDKSTPKKTAAKKAPADKAVAEKAAVKKPAAASAAVAAAAPASQALPASPAAPPPGGATGRRAQPAAAQLYEEIRLRAYELYCGRGGQHGSHEADWHRAELEVRSKYR